MTRRHWPWSLLAGMAISLWLVACGGGHEDLLRAKRSDIAVISHEAGVTPFIALVHLGGKSLAYVASVGYSIAPKPGAVSRPVTVSYSTDALRRRGHVDDAAPAMTLPVFGLYRNHANQVQLSIRFADGSMQTLALEIATADYVDPRAVYDRPTILQPRVPGSVLGFDFVALKSALGTPVIVDTDGELRWVAAGISNSISTAFKDNGFVIGEQMSTNFHRLELDGSMTAGFLNGPGYANFHHNLDAGKRGLLANVDLQIGGANQLESVLAEFDDAGAVIEEWDLAAILSAYMRSLGDDPSGFVRPGVDWFHMNAATYDARDDSVIVSSRENFIIKLGYTSREVIWILGDPTKYWHSFASLRAKALTLAPGGLYPIGQHAPSITSDGLLMIFNNGLQSINAPVGAPVGDSRSYSAVSAYEIDAVTMTAREAWRFDHGQTVLSIVCSSAYEAPGQSVLVSYAVADGGAHARLVGLNAAREVVFEFQYTNPGGCNTSWNAIPVPLENINYL